jgi:hypothetical protein
MKTGFVVIAAALAGLTCGQSFSRSANITGRRFGDRDRCTVSVVVDGTAQVEIGSPTRI